MSKIRRYGIWPGLLVCLQLFIGITTANAIIPAKTERILIVLDASASMQQEWQDNITRYRAASDFILQLMDSVYARNNEVEFALRVYGHQSAAGQNNCYDTKLEVMYSMDNYTQIGLRLASLHASGITPVTFAVNEGIEYDMADVNRYNYHLVIVTDGGESCGGNICDLTKKLANRHIPPPCIISLANDAVMKKAYSCLGNYQVIASKPGVTSVIHNMLTGCCIVPPLQKYKAPDDEVITKNIEDRILVQESLRAMDANNRTLENHIAAPELHTVNLPEMPVHDPDPLVKDTMHILIMKRNGEIVYQTPVQHINRTEVPAIELPAEPLPRDTIALLKPSGSRQVQYVVAPPTLATQTVPEIIHSLSKDNVEALRPGNNKGLSSTVELLHATTTAIPNVVYKDLFEPLQRTSLDEIKPREGKQVSSNPTMYAAKAVAVPNVAFKDLYEPLVKDTIGQVMPIANKYIASSVASPKIEATRVPEIEIIPEYEPLATHTVDPLKNAKSKQFNSATSQPAVKKVAIPEVVYKELYEPLPQDNINSITALSREPVANNISKPAVKKIAIPKNTAPVRKNIVIDTFDLVKPASSNMVYNVDNLKRNVAVKLPVPKPVRTGFLKIVNEKTIGRVSFYFARNGNYEFYLDIQINEANVDQRFILQEGKYRITYKDNNLGKEFKIASQMITELAL